MSIVLFLALVLIPALGLLADQIGQNRRRFQRQTNNQHHHSQSPSDIPEHQARAHEYEHREYERVFWKRSIYGTIATVGVAVSAVIFAYLTFNDAHNALVAVQRAFVYIDLDAPTFNKIDIDEWRVKIAMENLGNTPTIDLHINPLCEAFDHEVDDPYTTSDRHHKFNRIIGPHQKAFAIVCSMTTSGLIKIAQGQKYYYFALIATYKDVFDNPHRYEFCGYINSMFVSNNVSNFADLKQVIGTDARMCKTHNCADEECKSD